MLDHEPTSRCCVNYRYSGYFIGYDGLTCELSGKPRRAPNNYTNRKSFAFEDSFELSTIARGRMILVCG